MHTSRLHRETINSWVVVDLWLAVGTFPKVIPRMVKLFVNPICKIFDKCDP